MRRPPSWMIAAIVALWVVGCTATPDDSAVVSTTSAPTTSTSTTTAAPLITTTSSTSTTTTSTTTTTTLPSTLEIEGSPLIEFSIEVGDGVALDRSELVAFVIETLSDERSWVGRGAGFRLVEEGGLFTMIVAEPDRVDQLCLPLRTVGKYSCARNGWIAFNSLRWFGATDDWPGDIETYRRYLVTHEGGHYIVGPSHSSCPGEGQLAPVMMQQTKGLNGCEPNGWVDP